MSEASIFVQFQSSPGQPTGCDAGTLPHVEQCDPVSILTRPTDRVRRGYLRGNHVAHVVSILTRPTDRVRPDELRADGHMDLVSILTRPTDRVRQDERCNNDCSRERFNPHPANRPGATAR